MIFLTVGTQLPFDRLVLAVDRVAPNIGQRVFGQIGASTATPKNFEWVKQMSAEQFDAAFRLADVVVAHAGIGTILTAQKYQKPVVIFPREARYGEHRNDHQIATCRQLEGRQGIHVARTLEHLHDLIENSGKLEAAEDSSLQHSRGSFVSALQNCLDRL